MSPCPHWDPPDTPTLCPHVPMGTHLPAVSSCPLLDPASLSPMSVSPVSPPCPLVLATLSSPPIFHTPMSPGWAGVCGQIWFWCGKSHFWWRGGWPASVTHSGGRPVSPVLVASRCHMCPGQQVPLAGATSHRKWRCHGNVTATAGRCHGDDDVAMPWAAAVPSVLSAAAGS